MSMLRLVYTFNLVYPYFWAIGCFQLLTIMNKAVMLILVKILFENIDLSQYLVLKLLGFRLEVNFKFYKKLQPFFRWMCHFTFPLTTYKEFPFIPYLCQHLMFSIGFHFNHSDENIVLSHSGFYFAFLTFPCV